jgi:hypothetical protein
VVRHLCSSTFEGKGGAQRKRCIDSRRVLYKNSPRKRRVDAKFKGPKNGQLRADRMQHAKRVIVWIWDVDGDG